MNFILKLNESPTTFFISSPTNQRRFECFNAPHVFCVLLNIIAACYFSFIRVFEKLGNPRHKQLSSFQAAKVLKSYGVSSIFSEKYDFEIFSQAKSFVVENSEQL